MTELFKRYYSRLAKEGFLKAMLWGMIVGGSALLISSFVFWVVEPKLFWISIIIWAVATIIATVVFYFLRFRPTTKMVATRLDKLGLKERMITMTELQNDTSFIAMKQRNDAKTTLNTIGAKNISFLISAPLICIAIVAIFFGAGMTTVTGLSSIGVIKTGSALIDEIVPEEPPEYVTVSYLVMGGAFIEGGNPEQMIIKGESTEKINVVPEDGWVFIGWSDGYAEPTREDKDVQEDIVVTAILFEIVFEFGDGIGEGQEGEDGQPSGENGKSDENSDDEGNPGGPGGSYEPSNQIIDGTTYYKESDRYEESYSEVIDLLENNGKLENGEELPPEIRAILDTYYQILE